MSVGFAALLSLCALHLIRGTTPPSILIAIFCSSVGVWPRAKVHALGLMTVAIVTLALRQLLR